MGDHIIADEKKVRELVQSIREKFQSIYNEFNNLDQYNATLKRAINDESLASVESYIKKVHGILMGAVPHFNTVCKGLEDYAQVLEDAHKDLT